MSDKQTLQSQITQLKSVLASPKTDGTTRKILENGLKKAEAKLQELEKAEKLESSKKTLTSSQEAKVEETKKESKSLAESLKQKVQKAKQKIATITPKATKKGGARSVSKAKELAKQRRSTQKKQSLADKDIESDANRFAINKTKRESKGGRANQYGTKAENKGGTYYEKRENRYDVQNKRYAKLKKGGSLAEKYTFFGTSENGWYVKEKKTNKFIKPMGKMVWETKEEAMKDLRSEKFKYMDGGMMADGGTTDVGGTIYSSEDLSGMFAKGGMTEHGLMVGDMIVSVGDDPYSIVVRNNGMESEINLNEGTRTNQGTRFASRSSKDPMVVRTQFEEMDFEYGMGGKIQEEDFYLVLKGLGGLKRFRVMSVDGNEATLYYSTSKSGYTIKKDLEDMRWLIKNGYIKKTNEKEYWKKEHDNIEDKMADGGTTDVGGTIYSSEDLSGMFKHGGGVGEGNLDMVKNQVIQVEHHAKELMQTLKSNPQVDAWVVAKMDRATTNLSDITHYLEGEKNSFGMGGKTTFKEKVKSISKSLYKRKKVSPSVQKDYGKTYSKDESISSAKRIAGAMRKKEMAKKKR